MKERKLVRMKVLLAEMEYHLILERVGDREGRLDSLRQCCITLSPKIRTFDLIGKHFKTEIKQHTIAS